MLRSQRVVTEQKWTGVDKRDFGDVVFMLSEEFNDNKADRERYIKKKGSRRGTVQQDVEKFDVEVVNRWVPEKNAEIRRKILQRLSQEFQED